MRKRVFLSLVVLLLIAVVIPEIAEGDPPKPDERRPSESDLEPAEAPLIPVYDGGHSIDTVVNNGGTYWPGGPWLAGNSYTFQFRYDLTSIDDEWLDMIYASAPNNWTDGGIVALGYPDGCLLGTYTEVSGYTAAPRPQAYQGWDAYADLMLPAPDVTIYHPTRGGPITPFDYNWATGCGPIYVGTNWIVGMDWNLTVAPHAPDGTSTCPGSNYVNANGVVGDAAAFHTGWSTDAWPDSTLELQPYYIEAPCPEPEISVVKTGTPSACPAGGGTFSVNWCVNATNTSTVVSLANVTISDPDAGIFWNGSLAPGGSHQECNIESVTVIPGVQECIDNAGGANVTGQTAQGWGNMQGVGNSASAYRTYSVSQLGVGAGMQYCCTPTAVDLISFEADPSGAGILVTWETAAEWDNLGFNLYRRAGPDGSMVQLNEALIPSESPGAGEGASYAFYDPAVVGGVNYHYFLEDVDVNGQRTMHGPVEATAPYAIFLPLLSR